MPGRVGEKKKKHTDADEGCKLIVLRLRSIPPDPMICKLLQVDCAQPFFFFLVIAGRLFDFFGVGVIPTKKSWYDALDLVKMNVLKTQTKTHYRMGVGGRTRQHKGSSTHREPNDQKTPLNKSTPLLTTDFIIRMLQSLPPNKTFCRLPRLMLANNIINICVTSNSAANPVHSTMPSGGCVLGCRKLNAKTHPQLNA